MHELALVREVVAKTLDLATQAHAQQVVSVTLTIGEGRDIIEDYFKGLFSYLTRDTPAEKACVHINRVPITARCKTCAHVYPYNPYRGNPETCPECGEANRELATGVEFTFDTIEVRP